jgi:hypothetical protein
MKKVIYFMAIILLILSCKKLNKKDNGIIISDNQENNLINETIIEDKFNGTKEVNQSIYKYQYFQIILFSKNIILKEKSKDENTSNAEYWFDEIYDIKYVDKKNNNTKIIFSDKFSNSWLLPIINDEIIMKKESDEITKRTTNSECFVLHRVAGSTYKLLYINEYNELGEMVINEYEYKTIWTPGDGLKILITPNYFIVRHYDIGGEEWILINRETREYNTIDSEVRGKH